MVTSRSLPSFYGDHRPEVWVEHVSQHVQAVLGYTLTLVHSNHLLEPSSYTVCTMKP